MIQGRRFGRSLLFCSAAMSAVISFSTAANAQQAAPISIPSQSLATALNTFGLQTGRAVMFKPELAAGKKSAPVDSAGDPEIALNALLSGTGLSWRRQGDLFLIEKVAADPQSGSAAGDGAEVEALIVTAQKREEDIQDVPIAISAFTQEALETHQIAGGPDLITQVPNMTFTKTNFSSYSIQLRGIGTQAISATTDPGVAVAFNNTPFIRNRFFEQEFYDLQRVEVLRGPQGTLYGRNATAGVVNIISQKPKFNFEAKLSGDIANYESTRLEGMVNIPLVEDTVALRLAGAWTRREGYAFNEITGTPIDGRDLWSTRLSLRAAPTDGLDINLIWEHFEENDDRIRSGKQLCKKDIFTEIFGETGSPDGVGVNITNIPFGANLPNSGQGNTSLSRAQAMLSQGCERVSLYSPDAFQTPNGVSVPYYVGLSWAGLPITLYDPYVSQVQSRDLRVIESTWEPEYRAKADLGELQVSFDITDDLTLSSETAYATDFVYSIQDFNRFNTVEGAFCPGFTAGDGCTVNLTDPGSPVVRGILDENGVFHDPQLGPSSRLVLVDLSTAKSTHFSQEFRLGSDFEGPFNFSVGANFLRYDTEDKYYVFINSLTLAQVNGQFPGPIPGVFAGWQPGVSTGMEGLPQGAILGDPSQGYPHGLGFIDPNPIHSVNDQGHNYFLSKNPYKLISYAVFGEAYYNITDNLKVTGGLRWTVDKKEAPRIPSWTFAANTRGYPVLEVEYLEWREPTGRLTIDWKPQLTFTDETLLYASYAHGYKAGGSNPPPMIQIDFDDAYYSYFGDPPESQTRPKTFEAEFIDAFELGAKNTLLDGALTLNLAGFYYDYTGYQISEIVDRSAFNQNYDAQVWGVEVEADWRPLENLKFGFKGGWEKTRIKDHERAIDLMDRTAGRTDWIVVRPSPTYASNCILPAWLFAHEGPILAPGNSQYPNIPNLYGLGSLGGTVTTGCEIAYKQGFDPVTNLPYTPDPVVFAGGGTGQHWLPGTYPGFNPHDASQGHNFGEGFFKDLGGNALPNAPEFTATLTADYTLPLPNEWLATLHTDLYWQAESWWRIFDDHEYNKLDEYFTTNVAAIFTNEDRGWKVMAYVKNVFDRDSITGAFLNSDDTGLTTNVFLTEPRLYGLRVTKDWTGGPLLGSFGARREGPYPFEVELGGQVQRHEADNATLRPSFADEFSDTLDPLRDQHDELDWGDGRDARLVYRPDDAWRVSAGVRFGKTNGSMPWSSRQEDGDKACIVYLSYCQNYDGPQDPYERRYNYSIASTENGEEHTLIDFAIGKDIGIGLFERSTLSAGLRHANLESTTSTHIFGIPNWDIPIDENLLFTKYGQYTATRDRFTADFDAQREFKGTGPVLSWEASKAFLGNQETGVMGLDWSVTGGVLFGRRETSVIGQEVHEHFDEDVTRLSQWRFQFPSTTTRPPAINYQRSGSVTAPTYGASLGLSYTIDRFKMGAGYRWETYQSAIDGGFAEAKEEDRTIDGPYFKVSVGFGG